MKYYLKLTFGMTLKHLIVQTCALIIGPLVLGSLIGADWFGLALSCVLAPIYAGLIYSHAWNVAQKELRSASAHKPMWWVGLVLPIATVVITGILALLWSQTLREPPDGNAYAAQMAYNLIFKSLFSFWNFTFDGFRTSSALLGPYYWICIFAVCPIASVWGYQSGMRGINFTETYLAPMIYKKDKDSRPNKD